MKKLRIIVCILLQAAVFCSAMEEKQFVLSKQDDKWLGAEEIENVSMLLHPKKAKGLLGIPERVIASLPTPQERIVSLIPHNIDFYRLAQEGLPYLQENINCAKNWLKYCNKTKKLNTDQQLEFCKALETAAQKVTVLTQDYAFYIEVEKEEPNKNFRNEIFKQVSKKYKNFGIKVFSELFPVVVDINVDCLKRPQAFAEWYKESQSHKEEK